MGAGGVFDEGPSDNKVHGANMGPTWVLSTPCGPHVGPINLAIRAIKGAVVLDIAFDHRYNPRS